MQSKAAAAAAAVTPSTYVEVVMDGMVVVSSGVWCVVWVMGEMLRSFLFSMYPTRILHTVTCLCRLYL